MISYTRNVLRNMGIGLVVILALTFAAQTYVKRGLQGRLRSSADDIGEQYSGKTTQYEPYYSGSTYAVDRVTGAAVSVDIPRKVIRNANISLKVSDAKKTQVIIEGIIATFKGTVINSNITRNYDETMTGTAVFKVLPQYLDTVMNQLRGIGEVQSENTTGEDVTTQYVDTQARLQNWKAVRDRLTKILTERAREVKDILEIERELARVGGEIESMEGRLKYLDRQVDFSTITVNYFTPKTVGIAKGINVAEKFRDTMRTSLETFVNTFNGVIVFLAFLLPLIIWVVIISLVILAVKKFAFAK